MSANMAQGIILREVITKHVHLLDVELPPLPQESSDEDIRCQC